MSEKKLTTGNLRIESELRDTPGQRKAIIGRYVEENTLIIFKPEALMRALVGQILSRFEDKGMRIIRMQYMWLNRELLERHYAHIAQKSFFDSVVEGMTRGPVIVAVLRGHLAIDFVRTMVGPTDPILAPAGTIRGDFATSLEEGNLIHASDSREAYFRELEIFFPELQTNLDVDRD